MNNQSNQSKIEIIMNGGKPVATVIYKGKKLCKSPVDLSIKTILARQPKRQDDTYLLRLAHWEQKLHSTITRQVLGTFAQTLYGDELNSKTLVTIDWGQDEHLLHTA